MNIQIDLSYLKIARNIYTQTFWCDRNCLIKKFHEGYFIFQFISSACYYLMLWIEIFKKKEEYYAQCIMLRKKPWMKKNFAFKGISIWTKSYIPSNKILKWKMFIHHRFYVFSVWKIKIFNYIQTWKKRTRDYVLRNK